MSESKRGTIVRFITAYELYEKNKMLRNTRYDEIIEDAYALKRRIQKYERTFGEDIMKDVMEILLKEVV